MLNKKQLFWKYELNKFWTWRRILYCRLLKISKLSWLMHWKSHPLTWWTDSLMTMLQILQF